MALDDRNSRRRFLARAGSALTATALAGRAAPAALAGPSAAPQLTSLAAVDAVAAMARGDLTAEQYASALLKRCAQGASLNAFITLRPEQVLEAARDCDRRRRAGGKLGPLHGLPIPIKDSLNTRDLPTTGGTEALRHFRPTADAPLVHALRSAGAIVLGKTNLHELSYGYTSNNHPFGAVHNPYDPTRIPGGSSGGTAAAIAYRMAPLGVAEDTEGSIRVPASLCGLAGFRPTTGRYSTVGAVPITPLFDQAGPHARNVADLLLFDGAVTGASTRTVRHTLNGVRLGVVRSFWYTNLDPEVEQITRAALETLTRAGAVLVEAELPQLRQLISLTTDPIQNHDTKGSLTRYLAEYHTGVSFEELLAKATPDLRAEIESESRPGSAFYCSEAAYHDAVHVHLPALKAMYRDYFARTAVAAIVFPTTILPAPPIGEEDMQVEIRGKQYPLDEAIARNIAPGSTAGLPGLVLPSGLTRAGLPVSLEFDGPAGSDRALLALGLSLERVLPPLSPPPRLAPAHA
jgi:indoleacetamide hydrolase